jgi:DNA (cytosine-5)-methyltransferase 1
MKPRLLDLFCKAGGCTKGYQRAGFHVVGVDIDAQPNYCGDEFVQADALEVLAEFEWGYPHQWKDWHFDAIHASPPCQAYTKARDLMGGEHSDLLGKTRDLLEKTGLPYVIENVKGAPLRNPQMLEGQMFGLNTHRPRLFETNWGYEAPFLRPPPPRQAKMGRRPKRGEAIQVVGHFTDMPAAQEAMGIDWMTRDELAQAIPPAYTQHIGKALMAHLREREGVAA